MFLRDRILSDLKSAMKSGDTLRRDVLRFLDSMIKNEMIASGKREAGLDDTEIIQIIRRAIKQRTDSFTQFSSAGRLDLAKKEQSEIDILSFYLPAQLDHDAVRIFVCKILDSVSNDEKNNFGIMMGKIMADIGDNASGTVVREVLQEEISKRV